MELRNTRKHMQEKENQNDTDNPAAESHEQPIAVFQSEVTISTTTNRMGSRHRNCFRPCPSSRSIKNVSRTMSTEDKYSDIAILTQVMLWRQVLWTVLSPRLHLIQLAYFDQSNSSTRGHLANQTAKENKIQVWTQHATIDVRPTLL